jgi:16S rRNA (guanine527-N7)-methyltransferase
VAQEVETLPALAIRLGLALSGPQRAGLKAFCELLLLWNARINLTGARTREELEGEHLVDAVAMAALAPPGARVVDVGSGGGLPAIPFALLRPDVALTMVEPRAKRVAFLRTAVRAAGVRAEVLPGRLEEVGLEERGFDVASSRATFAPKEWLQLGPRLAPLVVVLAARGADVEQETGSVLEREVVYQTGRGHPRWAGAFRFT